MARSIRDNLKRACGQAVNHLSAAIMDINTVYEEFTAAQKPEADQLKAMMIGLNTVRDVLLAFVLVAWAIDEDQLMSYL